MSGNDQDFDEDRRHEAGRWLTVAAADMRAVRLCLDADEPMFGIAAYHCQQAAEKVVKGMFVVAGIPFARRTISLDSATSLRLATLNSSSSSWKLVD
jgi:HEPN domain-containing protein